MKKTNKKGFTLAELLIVIAIIAVLIAIAIPTFSGALRNAKLQTDHANIRSAYAMVMTANMMNGIDLSGGTGELTAPEADKTYYFQKDGTLVEDDSTNAYKLQVTPKAASSGASEECGASAGCKTTSQYVSSDTKHEEGGTISITCDGSKYTLVVKK